MDLFDSFVLAALLGLGSFGFFSFLADFLGTVFDRLLFVSFFCYFLVLREVLAGDLEADLISDLAGDVFFEAGTSFTSSITSTLLDDCLPEVFAGEAFTGEGIIADLTADCFRVDRFAGDGEVLDFKDFAGDGFKVDFFAEAYLLDLAGDFLGDDFGLARCSSTCMSKSTSSSSSKSSTSWPSRSNACSRLASKSSSSSTPT